MLPAFVISEVEAFLRCGILAQGLILAKCRDCGWCRPVAFACRRRGFCPSCIGRRMSDFATQLVDRVIPRVPVRQWVLTVPHGLRAKMMFDPALISAVLRELIRAVSSWLRQRARRQGVVGAIKTGAVTVIQRFNSALGANPHFHTLFADGVYSFPVGRAPVFHPTPAPTDEDVARVAAAVFRRVERRLADREPAAVQRRFVEDAPVLVALAEASVGGVVATGPRRGRRIRSRARRGRGQRAGRDALTEPKAGHPPLPVESPPVRAAARASPIARWISMDLPRLRGYAEQAAAIWGADGGGDREVAIRRTAERPERRLSKDSAVATVARRGCAGQRQMASGASGRIVRSIRSRGHERGGRQGLRRISKSRIGAVRRQGGPRLVSGFVTRCPPFSVRRSSPRSSRK